MPSKKTAKPTKATANETAAEETPQPASDTAVEETTVEQTQVPVADPAKDAAAAASEEPVGRQLGAGGGKRVRVICEGRLGHRLLTKGDETSDPRYVAILKQKGQKKVEAV